jgi:hypothetical protein
MFTIKSKILKFLDLQIGSISKALNKCNSNSVMKQGHLFKIYCNIEQVLYPHAHEQSC